MEENYEQKEQDQYQYVEQPQFTNQPVEKTNGFSVAALVCGILSLVCCCFGFAFIIGIAGIVLAIIGIQKSPKSKKTMGIIALILSVLGTIFGLVTLIGIFTVFQDFDFNYYMNLPEDMQQQYMEDYLNRIFY